MAGKISISVTDAQATRLRKAVGSGACAASSAVVREALREWQARRGVCELWDEGPASGRCNPGVTMADIRRAARRREALP